MPDDETTYAQLYERLRKTIEALKTVKPEAFEGKEQAEVVVRAGREYRLTGVSYLQYFGEGFV